MSNEKHIEIHLKDIGKIFGAVEEEMDNVILSDKDEKYLWEKYSIHKNWIFAFCKILYTKGVKTRNTIYIGILNPKNNH